MAVVRALGVEGQVRGYAGAPQAEALGAVEVAAAPLAGLGEGGAALAHAAARVAGLIGTAGRAELEGMVRQLRQSVDPSGVGAVGDLKPFDFAVAHKLYELGTGESEPVEFDGGL